MRCEICGQAEEPYGRPSDRLSEFGERRRHPAGWTRRHSQFVDVAEQILDDGMAAITKSRSGQRTAVGT
jgi:hypothetical protein